MHVLLKISSWSFKNDFYHILIYVVWSICVFVSEHSVVGILGQKTTGGN